MVEAARGKNGSVAAEAAAAVVVDDMGDGTTTCSNHPYRNNLGGICAFCLQEKLGKLVSSSSSFPFPVPNSPASSSSTPVSDIGSGSSAAAHNGSSVRKTPYSGFGGGNYPGSRLANNHPAADGESSSSAAAADTRIRAPRIPFLLARRKKKKKLPPCPSAHCPPEAVLKRSKSSAAGPRRHFMDDEYDYSPRIRRAGGGGGGFWSFLHLSASSSSSSKSGASRRGDKPSAGSSKVETLSAFEEEISPCSNATGNGDHFLGFERKVSRSRSVGCGSRSFSGDLFERISTGFGDCTLRRVVSHREAQSSSRATPKQSQQPHRMYKCGGIFGGFMMIAAPSASSSSYWVPDHSHHQVPGKTSALSNSHPRARSWNWAFPSPMRAFAKPNKDVAGKREVNIIRDGSGKHPGPNLSAIPSLLTVGGG